MSTLIEPRGIVLLAVFAALSGSEAAVAQGIGLSGAVQDRVDAAEHLQVQLWQSVAPDRLATSADIASLLREGGLAAFSSGDTARVEELRLVTARLQAESESLQSELRTEEGRRALAVAQMASLGAQIIAQADAAQQGYNQALGFGPGEPMSALAVVQQGPTLPDSATNLDAYLQLAGYARGLSDGLVAFQNSQGFELAGFTETGFQAPAEELEAVVAAYSDSRSTSDQLVLQSAAVERELEATRGRTSLLSEAVASGVEVPEDVGCLSAAIGGDLTEGDVACLERLDHLVLLILSVRTNVQCSCCCEKKPDPPKAPGPSRFFSIGATLPRSADGGRVGFAPFVSTNAPNAFLGSAIGELFGKSKLVSYFSSRLSVDIHFNLRGPEAGTVQGGLSASFFDGQSGGLAYNVAGTLRSVPDVSLTPDFLDRSQVLAPETTNHSTVGLRLTLGQGPPSGASAAPRSVDRRWFAFVEWSNYFVTTGTPLDATKRIYGALGGNEFRSTGASRWSIGFGWWVWQ